MSDENKSSVSTGNVKVEYEILPIENKSEEN